METPRSVLIFEQYIQSPKTREQYRYHLDKFANHYGLESLDSILSIEIDELKRKIEDYVILFKNEGKSPNYIRIKIFALQSFCDSNDLIGVNWKKIRRLLGKKQKPRKSRPYTTNEIKRMLSAVKDLRSKALILFLSSSGIRRGAIPELKIKHLKEMPNDCLAVTVYAGSDEEYTTFINKEAKQVLTLYFERRKKDGEHLDFEHPVFRNKYLLGIESPIPFSDKSVSNLIGRAKKNSGIDLDDSPNLLCHAFRRRFNTVLKLNRDSNPTIIERLMGHDMKLDNSYFQPTLEELFQEYQKGMIDLTIDDSERVLQDRKYVESKKIQLDVQEEEIKNQKDEIELLKLKVERMMKSIEKEKIIKK